MQLSSATSSTLHFTRPRRNDAPRRNYGTASRVITRSKTPRFPAKPVQPAANRDFHLDTFFNPVWMSGPHVFSYAKDGKVVRPETHQVVPYPGYNAASSGVRGAALPTSTSRLRVNVSKPSTRIEKPWKNVAITEQDDADFVAMAAKAKARARAEARGKLVGLVYTWPPEPQAAACVECEVLAGSSRREVPVVGTRVGPGMVVGPRAQPSSGTDMRESVVPALSHGSSGESESESEVFKVGKNVVGRREDPIEKYVGFGRVGRKTSASLVLEGVEEGEGVNRWMRSKVDDVWNPIMPETWVEDELTFSNICGTVYRQGNVLFTPDGNSLLSPVGNRVAVFDLVNNKSRTLPFENRKNIAVIALSPDARLLLSVDDDGRAVLVHFRRGVVLHHIHFKKPVTDVQFSPDGKYIAVTHDAHVQVWCTPNHLVREFAPFVLHRTYTGHHDEVLTIRWAPDSTCFITTSRDMTARLFTLNPVEGFRPKTFAGHRDAVVGAYFSSKSNAIYTISRDGAVFTWKAKTDQDMDTDDDDDNDSAPAAPIPSGSSDTIPMTRWGIHERHYFNLPNTKVVCTTFHPPSNLLVVGFSTGVFGLWEMPQFTNIHTLSISQEKISSIDISSSGEWLAFGARKLGQLLVWEWQSESYVLKQQGHYFDMNTLAYAPDGQTIATGGDDGKLKVWSVHSGFCFVTFSEHTAPVMDVTFAKQGSVLFSASLDGTVRAYDLVRYRNFRTFTSPSPVQFSALAVDPSGEVVAAGSTDSFEIFMWSVQTGKLLDVLSGHEAPISSLSFCPSGSNQLASGSWDKSVRIWSVFGRSRAVESLSLSSDVLSVAFRPDGAEIAASTLDGQITFFDVRSSKQTNFINGRKDISGGRKADDRVSAANNASSKAFTSMAYTADGTCILAGGNSKYVVLFDVREAVLVKKFQISENLSLDGTQEFLDSRKVNSMGINTDLIDDRGDASDLEDRMDTTLPGAARGAGDMSVRKYRQEARTKCVRFSPTGRAWAAASTEGLLIYALDESLAFDPFDLTIDLTPQSVLEVLAERTYLKALVLAFRLNEKPILQRVYESVPRSDVRLVARQMPVVYVPALLQFIAEHLERGPHVEFDLVWVHAVLMAHGRYLRDRNVEMAPVLRAVQKALGDVQETISNLCDANTSTLRYMIDQSTARHVQGTPGA